jgi:hypothetical protein
MNISITFDPIFGIGQFFRFTISINIFDLVLWFVNELADPSDVMLILFCVSYLYLLVFLKYQKTTYKGKRSRMTLSKTYPTSYFPAERSNSKIKSIVSTQQNIKQKDLLFCKWPITFSSNLTFIEKDS